MQEGDPLLMRAVSLLRGVDVSAIEAVASKLQEFG
jgi:hypothetical protein